MFVCFCFLEVCDFFTVFVRIERTIGVFLVPCEFCNVWDCLMILDDLYDFLSYSKIAVLARNKFALTTLPGSLID